MAAKTRKAPPRAQRMAPDERRAGLMESVIKVFASRGIGEARHAHVAQQAKVSLSTVFVYFPTREALVEAALDETARFFLESAAANDAEELPAPAAIAYIAQQFADLVDTHPEYVRLYLSWSSSVGQPHWKKYLEAHAIAASRFADMIARGKREKSIPAQVKSEDAAELILGASHVLAQMKFMGKDRRIIDQFIASLARSIIGGG